MPSSQKLQMHVSSTKWTVTQYFLELNHVQEDINIRYTKNTQEPILGNTVFIKEIVLHFKLFIRILK
jgi:hypothetical protein